MSAKKAWLLAALLLPGCRTPTRVTPLAPVSAAPPAPASAQLYTATGAVRALATGPEGTLWAATAGGALCWPPGAASPRRWTAASGLAGSDVRVVVPLGAGALAATPTKLCRLGAGAMAVGIAPPVGQEMRCLLRDKNGHSWLGTNRGLYIQAADGWRLRYAGETWRMASEGTQSWAATARGLRRLEDGKLLPLPATSDDRGTITALAAGPEGVFLATALGLWRWDGRLWREIPLPPGSTASHVSALCIRVPAVYAGLYGDGVYRWRESGWERLPDTSGQMREVTALATTPAGLAAGTRAAGIWDWVGGMWHPRALPGALPSGDIYSLIGYRGALWAGTFDSGLLCLDTQGRTRTLTQANGLRADAPRALVVFGSRLYVRHTTGQVDCTEDGQTWRPAWTAKELPRSLVSTLATDGERLYVGGWAGWSAWNGKVWEHHDHDPPLAHQVVTAIAARPGEVWIGTQKQGVFRYAGGRYTHFYEAQGLTDDWITCLSATPSRVLVGTYTGGLLQLGRREDPDRFSVILRPQTFAIRAVCLLADGRAVVATPLGVYLETPAGWHLLDLDSCGGAETQALLPLPTGIWIGSRTGLAFLPQSMVK